MSTVSAKFRNVVSGYCKVSAGLLMLLILTACGSSGGGDSSDSDSGDIALSLTPQTITPGSLAFMSAKFRQVFFDDLDSQGLTLKLALPNELVYATGSAALTIDTGAFPIDPVFVGPVPENVAIEMLSTVELDSASAVGAAGGFTFLIFAIAPERLARDDDGVIDFNLRVGGRPRVGYVFGDLDRGASTSFDPNNSDFDTEIAFKVEVSRPPIDEDE